MEFFNSIRLRQKSISSIDEYGKISYESEIIGEFLCSECNKWFNESDIESYYIPCSISGVPDLAKIKFICKDCYNKN